MSNRALIFLEFKVELALFCQLHLIAVTRTPAICALIARDEREQCPLKAKLSDFPRGGFKPRNSIGDTIGPVRVELNPFQGLG